MTLRRVLLVALLPCTTALVSFFLGAYFSLLLVTLVLLFVPYTKTSKGKTDTVYIVSIVVCYVIALFGLLRTFS